MTAILGIDPSLTATGLARADGSMTCFGGLADRGDDRLLVIHDAIYSAALVDGADLAVLEDLPTHAHGAGITGMVQGVVRLALRRRGVPYATVVGSTLKKYATGNGAATKSDMRMALYKRAGIDERNDNKVDAWWLWHMGMDHLAKPVIALPAAQRACLDVVRWPEGVPS